MSDQNTGHGHVRERPDGVKARCGGPRMCVVCARDLAALGTIVPASAPTIYDASDDKVRPATQADVDELRDGLACAGQLLAIMRALGGTPGVPRPIAERLAYLRRVRAVAENDGYGPTY